VGIDLLFVDGPPKATGPQARFPAIPVLLSQLSDDALIVLDDTAREDERAISDRWVAEYAVERTVRRFEKGARIFRRTK
jgi:hypothetical protein